jgi:hypothetical protein
MGSLRWHKIGWLVLKTKYFNTAVYSDVFTVFAYKVLMKKICIGSIVVEHSTYNHKIEGLNPSVNVSHENGKNKVIE